MKKTVLTLALSLSAITAANATDVINFTGKVTASSCTITSGTNGTINVPLPTVSASELAASGAVQGRTPFFIELSACDGNEVSAYFNNGSTVDANGRLINTATADAATNVGLQLLNSKAQPVLITAPNADGTQTNSEWVKVEDQAAKLAYAVEYYATGAATAGDLTSSVEYTLVYK